jgi:HEAT repeat protein
MKRLIHSLLKNRLLQLTLACSCLLNQAHAFVDLAPTLSKIIADSQRICLVEVVQFNHENHALVLKAVRAIKGDLDGNPIQHDVAAAGGSLVPRSIQQWAAPGARGVLFLSRATELLCLGEGWYAVRSSGSGEWKLGADRADLPLAYYGSVSRLADGITRMLAGKDAILTTVQHGVDDAASFDLALNRQSLPGLIRVQRIRANMTMPTTVAAVSANPAYLIGKGRVGEEDLPQLLTQLEDPDATVRAESADELRDLGHKAGAAEKSLTKLLDDKTPRVRFSSASALLCINKENKNAVQVLANGLTDPDSNVRRDAAKAAGRSGPGAAPLIDNLALLLKDDNEPTRVSALQAIALLGPIAASAAPAVVPLLDDSNTCIEAADALGRIGPRARPAPKRLAEMLSSGQTAIQWAALRAMAQIGGKESHPAVDFIVGKLHGASEINLYNMMIYLALLGPDAADAIPAAQNTGLAQPIIPSATIWAMKADRFPWESDAQGGMRDFGGRGGPGGGGPGGGGPGGPGLDLYTTMYEAYIRELGERLRPLALVLAQKIVDGTAGDVPTWGYKLLNCAPDDSVSKLSACLSDSNIVVRERAAVALGYMGTAAFAAKDRVSQARDKAATEQERHLLEWCLREIA